MKAVVVLFGLLVATSAIYEPKKEEQVVALAAIRDLSVEYFAKNGQNIVLMLFGVQNGFAETFAKKLLRGLPASMSVEVQMLGKFMNDVKVHSSSILLFDSVENFITLPSQLKLVSKNGAWFKQLLYAPGLNSGVIYNKFSRNVGIGHVAFLLYSRGSSIDLATSFIFETNSCHMNQIMIINSFSRRTQRWENAEFYPKKYDDFQGCTVDVKAADRSLNLESEKIFKTLAKNLNFKLNRTDIDYKGSELVRYDEQLVEKVVEQRREDPNALLSSAIFFDALTFAVPSGEPLTDLERMFAAFDDETWIGIGVTFAIALVSILVISMCSKKVQNFVFGRNIRMPTLNLFNIFLTGGQARVPGRNFARYLLMLFILWSLIFRTCYQSKMYENLNRDMRHPRVRTISKLEQRNFTVIVAGGYVKEAERYGIINNKTEVAFDLITWFRRVPEPPNKLAFLISRVAYKHFIKSFGMSVPSIHLLEDDLVTTPYFIRLPRYLPYCPVIRQKINQIIASGLIMKWSEERWEFKSQPKVNVEDVGPQVLTLEHLKLGFLAYLICMGISFAVFLVELILKPCITASVGFYFS